MLKKGMTKSERKEERNTCGRKRVKTLSTVYKRGKSHASWRPNDPYHK